MGQVSSWKHGGVLYPLAAATDNPLLQDADPALYWALQLFSSVLNTYVGPRLDAEASKVGLSISSAVKLTISVEPTPFLLNDQFKFPILAIFRKSEGWAKHTETWARDDATWEWSYVLPPMTPVQTDALAPILRAVAVVMRTFATVSMDPAWQGGATLRDLSGIMKMFPGDTSYGGYAPIDQLAEYYRAVTGKLLVQERQDIDANAYGLFTGADVEVDLHAADGTTMPDVSDFTVSVAPTLTNAVPSSGTKAGNTSVTFVATGLRVGTPITISIGGLLCASAVVTSATSATATTPAHPAYDTFLADVVLTADDGQSATLTAGFTFTTP